MKRATITLTTVVDYEDGEDPIAVLEASWKLMYEGAVGEIIEPHVDAVEDIDHDA